MSVGTVRGVEKRPKGRNSGKLVPCAVLERRLTACGKHGGLSTFIHREERSRGGLSEKGPSRALPESTCETGITASSRSRSRLQGSEKAQWTEACIAERSCQKPPHNRLSRLLIFLGLFRPAYASFGELHNFSALRLVDQSVFRVGSGRRQNGA